MLGFVRFTDAVSNAGRQGSRRLRRRDCDRLQDREKSGKSIAIVSGNPRAGLLRATEARFGRTLSLQGSAGRAGLALIASVRVALAVFCRSIPGPDSMSHRSISHCNSSIITIMRITFV